MTIYTARAGEGDGRTTTHPTAADAWHSLAMRREVLETLHGASCWDPTCERAPHTLTDLSDAWQALDAVARGAREVDDYVWNGYALADDGTGELELPPVSERGLPTARAVHYVVAVAGASSQAGVGTFR